jgi:NAD(P)-dependent dehydrogenase (short-subunit alcohol dehydrogenase family)
MKKNLLLVGGSSDIGSDLINLIDKKKYNIYYTYNSNKRKIDNVNNFQIDLSSLEDIDKLILHLKKKKIKFDNVIFLQGVIYSLSLSKYSDKKIYNTFLVNTLSIIFITKKILTLLKKDSLVVLVSSISGSRGSYDPIYSASKAALHGFTKSMSQWLTPKTKIICLCPGPVKETRNFKRFSKKRQNFHIKKNPLKKLINSKEFARILLDITKPHWKFANGSIIEINGGVY